MNRYLYLFLEHLAITPRTLRCLACRFMLVGKGTHEDRDSATPLVVRQIQRIGNPFLNRQNLQPRYAVQTLADDSGDRHNEKYLKDKKSSTKLPHITDVENLLASRSGFFERAGFTNKASPLASFQGKSSLARGPSWTRIDRDVDQPLSHRRPRHSFRDAKS